MNFFAGAVVALRDGKASVETKEFGLLAVTLRTGVAAGLGQSVILGFRPEKLTLSREAGAGPCVRGQIVSAAYFGDRSQFQVAIAGAARPVIVSAQNSGRHGVRFEAGDVVCLSWAADAPVLLPNL